MVKLRRFCWTENAKNDLMKIVEEADPLKRNWTNISTMFKNLHPSYEGQTDSLRKQYIRIKENTSCLPAPHSTEKEKKFKWSDQAATDLLSIVSTKKAKDELTWSDVATQFKELHPLFKGGEKALHMQYSRLEGNKPVQHFIWTKDKNQELARLVNLINVDGYPNWSKICKTFNKIHPDFDGTKVDLKLQYETLLTEADTQLATIMESQVSCDWDESFNVMLAQAIGRAENIIKAQIRDGRRHNIENCAKLTVKLFKEYYKARTGIEYLRNDAIILNHYYVSKEKSITSSFVCEDNVDSMSNIEHKTLLAYASKNHTMAFSNVLKECCHNCGMIFPRTLKSMQRKILQHAINGVVNVVQTNVNVPYIYSIDGKYITCVECFKVPNWQDDYSLMLSTSNQCGIPKELSNLNEYEQNQIALCGGFYSVYKKQNVQSKIFEHRQGECNIGKKRDMDYHKVYTTYYNIERPVQLDCSGEKIKTALRWLRKNNRLYKDFLSNYETIYGYLLSHYNIRPEERIIQISKGNLPEIVGKETSGLFLPADNIKIESELKAEFQKFGIQHPLQGNLNKLRDIINVNYSDPDLEAKRWPHLFPEGNGSWKKGSSLKQQTYVKHRLLGLDSRFRRNNEFMFFWYDRLIKERLLYVNQRQRTVNVQELINPIHAKDLRENHNKYGSVVPSTIPGSRTYWSARCSDLLAQVRDLGKPELFVTLTQNDNWHELQKTCGEISADELLLLNQPIMQPAIGGKSVVHFPVETVIAFYKRLEMFMQSCVHNKNGPFGEVIDYWFRIEYQNRGALHCHMVLWVCEDTLPENVVMAEMPRYSGSDNDIAHLTFVAREYVKTFQIHSCSLSTCKKDVNSKCKYGFPYGVQLSEEINQSKMGYTYIRKCQEDKNIVPYNIYALMCWNGHINVQKVTANGIEAYLCKYVSKPERSIDIKDITSDAERFLKARVAGILEVCAHLLQFHQVGSSRKTLFLPCDFKPKQRMLKRRVHLPQDSESDDVYYKTLLHKYLVRPKELHNLTYVDLFRFYDVGSANANSVYTQNSQFDSQEESETEIKPKLDESQFEFTGRVRKIRSQRMTYISRGFKYVERGKAAVPRWRFLMPFGKESEKYYEQRLLFNVPLTDSELNEDGYPFSDDNISKTFVEECCLRGLVDSEETAKSALLGAVQRGFSVERVIELATLFVDQSFVSKEYVDSIIIPWVETMPVLENDTQKETENEYGEELAKMVEMRVKHEPYNKFFESMTDSQKNVMEWVDRKVSRDEQILAIISGGAGVGKSYITKALYSYFIEKKMVCILLATTGSAAHLISGTTVHYYLKVDIHGNSYLQPGTISAKIVEDTDVIILDEFSMLNSDLLDQLNDCTKQYGKSKRLPLGGKHIFLIGDPCQLPAIGKSVFCNSVLNEFSILLLKETVRQQDEQFAALLNRVRINTMTEVDKDLLKTRYVQSSHITCDDNTLIVTATRKKMMHYNSQFIKSMKGDEVRIIAQDFEQDTNKEVSPAVKEKIRRYLTNLWDEQLVVKEGCIVRLLRNLDVPTGWVNSKRAKVFRAASDGSFMILQDLEDASKQLPITKIRQPFKLGANLYYRYQYPLILGYATTVHAVQGTTVTSKYYVDLDRSFWESGQAFVALSRPKELSQLFLLNTHFEKVYLKPYYKELLEWMAEVDEISIMRKPRICGDFPLIPLTEQNQENAQCFPLLPEIDLKKCMKNKNPFKPPRKLKKENRSVNDFVEQPMPSGSTHTNIQVDLESIESSPGISRRVYMLAENFMNSCRNSSLIINRLMFGIKFMNEVLEQVNSTLSIFNVTDPLLCFEAHQEVSESLVRQWDAQVIRTMSCFRKYACQFKTEFETFENLILNLEVSKYDGQVLASDTTVFYQEGRKWLPIRVIGDGRCFYHSVSYNLLGNATLSNSLKLLLAFVVVSDYDIYDAIFSRLGSSASNVTLKTLSYNHWADIEIILGMSYTLRRPITVVSGLDISSQSVQSLTYNPLDSDKEALMVAHVRLSKEHSICNHFVALLNDGSYVPTTSSSENENEEEIITIPLPDEDVEMQDAYESLTESL